MKAMNLFAIFAGLEPDDLDRCITESFDSNDCRKLKDGQWLVFSEINISSGMYEKLIEKGGNVNCIIVPFLNYYGWQDKAVWEWVDSHE